MWQAYHSVSRLTEAMNLLDEHRGAARIIAGGTDLIIEMERGARPDLKILIDITRVPGLDRISRQDGRIVLGPLVTHNHVVASPLVRQRALPLAQASWEVGAPQIRNRATVAGNLITASPANDTITPLIAMEAEVRLESLAGARTLKLSDFCSGFRQTVMQPNEVMTQIRVPPLADGQRGVFLKLGLRRAQAISVVDAAVVLQRDAEGRVWDARIALGSVAPVIVRAAEAERYLEGKRLSDKTMSQAGQLASAAVQPIDDIRGSAEYRSEMVRALVVRALRQLAADEIETGLPENPPMLWDGEGPLEQSLGAGFVHLPDTPIESRVNGVDVRVETGQRKSLLHWLRDDLGLPGTKEGCAEGECGACTVILDGAAVMACMAHAPRAHRAEVLTVEGLADGERLHPLQQAFIDEAAVQCGYCTPGFLMAGAKLLEEVDAPSAEQINYGFSGNLCRCTGYYKIVEAFRRASQSQEAGERG